MRTTSFSTAGTKTVAGIARVQKRDGSVVPFDISKIERAIFKAMIASHEGSSKEAADIAKLVTADLIKIAGRHRNFLPSVEGIQDAVEEVLMRQNYGRTAKQYILYRENRAKIREKGVRIPTKVKKLAAESKKYFRNPLGEFIYYRTYSRWIEKEQRRETWIETVDRYMDFMKENLGERLEQKTSEEIRAAILNQQAMPSMRLLQFAGPPARATNVCAYNCSFIAPKCIQDFAEIMYISMCGTGLGFSVESRNIQALPQIMPQSGKKLPTQTIADSKEGWADALAFGLRAWFAGHDVEFDYSELRPAGARLKTMGGKSSGPEPLRNLLDFARDRVLKRQGRRLSTLDAHDIICMIGDCVVSGGVRRSAMISLSDLDDIEMRDAKKGQFYLSQPQRSIANNSAVYTVKPTTTEFMEEWLALMKSGSGERGIYNRVSLAKTLPKRRLDALEGNTGHLGVNPCGEIILQSKQFCNLTEVVARADDTERTLLKKVRIAAILGTYQATLTYFPYLSPEWKANCEKERLLGVSITGQWDCPAVRNEKTLEKLRLEAIKVNEQYSKKFGITPATCVTCVKPSGTLSQTVDCSSGMHPRHAPYYIRRVRISATDSLFKMLRDQGVPYHPEVGQTASSAITFVLEFPVKAPKGAIYRNDISAIEQLEHWKLVKKHFTEHNPSVTVSVGENEWIKVGNWVYENWDIVGGLSFLPRDNHVYQLAPYEPIDEARYEEMKKRFGDIDFSKIITYERSDETEAKKELACAGGICEIV